ncbi:MAG: hypothetical protein K6E27_02980 [Eubacterium sp.]|nr:hypothetical protein [Eubacterium sp.]
MFVKNMPEDFEIRPFLLAHRAEVIGMMFMDYNEEETMRLVRKEAEEDGRAQGSNDAFRAIDLINKGVKTLKGLIDEGIPESIAQTAISHYTAE